MIVAGEAPSPSHRCSPSAATAGEELGREPLRTGPRESRCLDVPWGFDWEEDGIDGRRKRTGGTRAATLCLLVVNCLIVLGSHRLFAILRFDLFRWFFFLFYLDKWLFMGEAHLLVLFILIIFKWLQFKIKTTTVWVWLRFFYVVWRASFTYQQFSTI